ncbi:MAG: H-type lectin domain-containing protein [Pseudotabrizicola sp.]|uniref:H-type lectin domain-containing protein n=1 Tax=Pseudotabrizicola sp. TaxID=2939647 RepID=UPI0027313412|nr:H-type lectin domain-containing protein [Pseudotabrizicola sp.]MDP2080107.1 H-type lectin domain-containing protein [Pseudotabrizicola sp.]MDZ7575553.1 H-type lectin domain-containing protein [Pseudotabrizicola sp.]
MKRFPPGSIAIAQGSRVLFSDFADGGVMWTGEGDRESRHIVEFKEPFRLPPAVHVGITMWDTDHQTNARADLTAENIIETGFHLVFKTWANTRVARIRADWMAIGQVPDEDDWEIE